MVAGVDRRYRLRKSERIGGRKRVDQLFKNGRSFMVYPLRVVYLSRESIDTSENVTVSIVISVPKRRVKKAVERNRVKRYIREAFRLNKHLLYSRMGDNSSWLDIALIYVKDGMSDFKQLQSAMRQVFQRLVV